MSRSKGASKPRKRSTKKLLNTLWAKPHKVSAHVTEEHDWHTEVPNVKLARVFGIVLVLHIVAVGGILAFKMIEKNDAAAADPEEMERARVAPLTDDLSDETTKGGMDVKLDDKYKHYRVRSGDNLLAVARRLGVSVSELEELNKLDSGNSLWTGQVLLVPNRTLSGLPPGEIQRLLNSSPHDGEAMPSAPPMDHEVVKATVAANDAAADTVDAGSIPAEPVADVVTERTAPVVKPAPAPVAAPDLGGVPEPVYETVAATSSAKTYTVAPGDTPYGIARKFGISHEALMRANGISDPRHLKVGQSISIPGN